MPPKEVEVRVLWGLQLQAKSPMASTIGVSQIASLAIALARIFQGFRQRVKAITHAINDTSASICTQFGRVQSCYICSIYID